jgi:hypothetical protein
MNHLLSRVQTKNHETIKKGYTILFKIQGFMILMAVILLIIDSNQLLTPAVLLIFFSVILLIISLFVLVLQATKNLNVRIKNSIDIVYQHYVKALNEQQDKTYTFKTDDYLTENWFLVPSYAQKDINYCLYDEDDQVKMYHAQAYTVMGNPPRRTIFFSGLYIVIKGVEGNLQYRDQDSISGNIIDALKSFYGQDQNDLNQFSKRTTYESGILYSNDIEEIPPLIAELISTLRDKAFIRRITIAVKEGELHVALEQKSIRLPYVKKYQNEALVEIKQTIEENVTLLNDLIKIVSFHQNDTKINVIK